MKKNIVLADCDTSEIQSLIDAIRAEGKEIECLSVISNGARNGKLSNLKRYIKYFLTPFNVFLHRDKYDYIIGWQQFYAVIFGFWCEIFHVKKQNRVIVVNYTYKKKTGVLGKVYERFMKVCARTKHIDYFHVLSKNYADVLSKELGIPREKFLVFPFGVDDLKEKKGLLDIPDRAPKEGYALAIGRSNRDYDYLVEVWKEIDKKLVIISDEYKNDKLPRNVILVNDVSGDDQYPWIANCSFMVIPIDNTNICSGDTVLLTAMAYEKTIFVTSPSTLAEMYVMDGVDSVYINKNVAHSREKINAIMNDSKANLIGKNARKAFLERYSRYAMGKNIAKYMVD